MKERLDTILVTRKLAKSRTAASVLIERGSVKVNGEIVKKPAKKVDTESSIEVTEPLKFVSRAGEKLDFALSEWQVDVKDMVVADVGASTGGFTDCLLKRGARKIYAIDVGTEQLDATLRQNPKVVNLEQTDVRRVKLPEPADLAVIDTSFISLEHVLPSVKSFLKAGGHIIALVKPQFEVGKDQAKNGIVSDESKRLFSLERIKKFASSISLIPINQTTSPITGSHGNVEYLLYLQVNK